MTGDRKKAAAGGAPSHRGSRVTRRIAGFTLIEIMIVVAIIGLIASMGVPSIFQVFRKEGMRRAVSDVEQILGDARARAIYTGQSTFVVFHPADKRMDLAGGALPEATATAGGFGQAPSSSFIPVGHESVTLPANVDIAMLDIDMLDRGGDEMASVQFYPNGTCQELTLVLHCGDEWQKLTLEFSTALASTGPVNP